MNSFIEIKYKTSSVENYIPKKPFKLNGIGKKIIINTNTNTDITSSIKEPIIDENNYIDYHKKNASDEFDRIYSIDLTSLKIDFEDYILHKGHNFKYNILSILNNNNYSFHEFIKNNSSQYQSIKSNITYDNINNTTTDNDKDSHWNEDAMKYDDYISMFETRKFD